VPTRSVRTRWFCGHSTGLATFLALPFFVACLPDPLISVPDLSPAGATDAGMMPRLDAPAGDLGSAKWGLDGTVTAGPTLRAAWIADPGVSEAFIVGHGGAIFHRISNGAWMAEASGTMANLYAIAARSATEVFAVGENGIILRRAAGLWKIEGTELRLTSALFGVTALGNGEVVAVGDGGVVARRQAAGVWTLESSAALGTASLRAVFGDKLDGLYAVGLGSTIARRMAGAWQPDPTPVDAGGSGNYYAIAGTTDGTELHIAGEYGLLLHRAKDGSRWQSEKLLPPMGMTAPLHLYSMYFQDGETIVAGAGGVVARRVQTGPFAVEPTGVASELFGLSGAGLRSMLVVGEKGTVLRRM
jgi:hypothetical protein